MNQAEIIDIVEGLLSRHDDKTSSPLIPVLQAIQEEQGYLSEESLRIVSEKTGASLSHVYGVATFYHQFRLRPEGKHLISICRGTACHVAGASDLYNGLIEMLELIPSEDTSRDGFFTLQEVRCLGACSLAPVIKVDDTVYGRVTPDRLAEIINEYRKDKQ